MQPIQRAENDWRFDPVDAKWSIVARNRRLLWPASAPAMGPDPASCAFCRLAPDGADTGSLRVVGRVDRGGASVLATPSPTPLLFTEHAAPPPEAYQSLGALGAHELLVPLGEFDHDCAWGSLPEPVFAALVEMFVHRIRDLGRDLRLASVQLSLPAPRSLRFQHPHAVLLASPHPPRPVLPPDRCPLHVDAEQAREDGRLLFEDEGTLAWVPYAPRASAHARLLVRPRGPEAGPQELAAWASISHRLLAALDAATGVQRAQLCMRRMPLRPSSERIPPWFAEVWVDDVDEPLAEALDVRMVSLPPRDLAEVLRSELG